jgi:hypothetical protein
MMVVTLGILGALWMTIERYDARDAGAGTSPVADTDADAGADVGADAGSDALSPHEREEAAKDAFGQAREALEAGDVDAANAALDAAEQFDPSNPDIAALRVQIRAGQPDGG